jgi:hypothetical protein
MAAQNNAQTVALQLEKVRDKLPLLYERDDMLLQMIQQRGDVERVSSRNMRLPLQIKPGGKPGYANMDGGDLGRGGGTLYDFAQVTPTFVKFATEITKLVEYATNAPEKAIENAAKREVKNAMAQFRTFLDQCLNASASGVFGTVSSINGNVVRLTKPPGAILFFPGETVQFYDSTLANLRGSANVVEVDRFGGQIDTTSTLPQISVDAMPNGVIATDVIIPDGLLSINPSSIFPLKYFQSNAGT